MKQLNIENLNFINNLGGILVLKTVLLLLEGLFIIMQS